MKCPDCPKITSHDDGDPEVEEIEDSEGSDEITVTVRRIRVCADCSTELKEAQLEISGTPEFTEPKDESGAPKYEDYDPDHCPARPPSDGERGPCEWEWEAPEAENTDRVQDTDRKGKKIKNSRYMTTYYGVNVTAEATCKHCGATANFTGEDDVPASGMDELV